MKLTETKLKQMILEKIREGRIPAHIPSTDSRIESKIAGLLTSEASEIHMGVSMLETMNLTNLVTEKESKAREHFRDPNTFDMTSREMKVTTYEFKVTQSFYEAILNEINRKNLNKSRYAGYHTIAAWDMPIRSTQPRIKIRIPYRLSSSKKYRHILRDDEPYYEMISILIAEEI